VPVVAGLAQWPETVPGVGVGYSAIDEGSAVSGVVVGLCGQSVAEVAEAAFAEERRAVLLPVEAVAALGGGSSALVVVASLFPQAVRAGAGA
jgi:hypothetical protein